MGLSRSYTMFDVLIVCHGGAHNDTICVAERKDAASMAFDFGSSSIMEAAQ
jgi:hypothetical protein